MSQLLGVPECAQLLDEIKPGWADLIDTDKLDMYDVHNCVLGQVFASEARKSYRSGYGYGVDALYEHLGPQKLYDGTIVIQPGVFSSNVRARPLWLKQIEARRSPVVVRTGIWNKLRVLFLGDEHSLSRSV